MEKEIMDILAQGAPIFARLVVAGIFALFACLVYPWLKEQKIYGQVVKFVRAAEKMAEAGKLDKAKKNAYVVALLEKAGVKVTPIVRAMIEAAVEELDLVKDKFLLGLPEDGDRRNTDDQAAETAED